MPVIEGIGDEVLQFIGCVLIASLVIAAWFSTKVRDVTSCRVCLNCITVLLHLLQIRSLAETLERSMESTASNNENIDADQQSSLERSQTTQAENDDRMETSNSSIARINTSSQGNEDIFTPQEATRVDDRIHLDVVESQTKEHNCSSSSSINDDVRAIKIKLKYMNDSLKIAEGYLFESLSEFKRRHFSSEISQGSAVILIFNGNILETDGQTLADYGLFDNCVVHCLVRQGRSGGNSRSLEADPRPQRRRRRYRLDVSFSVVVFPILGVMLLGMWYLRYCYSELFSMIATVGLLMLTGLYIAVLVGSRFPQERVGLVPVM